MATFVLLRKPVPWRRVLCLMHALLAPATMCVAADSFLEQWPHTFVEGGVTNTLYQPQLESWDYRTLKARLAASIQPAGSPRPTYGTLSVTAQTRVDRAARWVYFDSLEVTGAQFPSAPSEADAWLASIRSRVPGRVEGMSLDRMEASLAILEARQKAEGHALRNEPPVIIFSTKPAMLILIDGPPAFRAVDGTDLERVVNTRALVLRDKAGRHYLHLFDGYVTAPGLGGPWTVLQTPGRELEKARKEAVDTAQVDLLAGREDPDTRKMPSLKTSPVPALYFATTPTELVVSDGELTWVPITGTQLLYASNTGTPVFKHLLDQKTYILLSGRWFNAPSMDGPWQFIDGKSLPADFAAIPDDSPMENAKAAVPGTRQAQEALIANSIPQTTKVDRGRAKMSPVPKFDGPIVLKPIEGTQLLHVANSVTPVIKVTDSEWYACQNGVWFAGKSAQGPWIVATSVPAAIYAIPVTSPLHYLTYVRIYSFDTSYVYVGVTPGYYGTVVTSSGVVVYGTGYVYPPFIGATVVVSYPITYGYAANPCWVPWVGWHYGYAAAWSWGVGYYYCPPAPYWGPYGPWSYGWAYNAAGGITAWGPYGWAGTSGWIYHQNGPWTGVTRSSAGFNAWTGNEWATQYGRAYNSVTGTRVAGRRGTVENVYTGNYASGGQGIAYNEKTGAFAAGEKVTVGNAVTGQSATAARGVVSGPGGRTVTARGAGTEGMGVVDVNGHAVATRDGNVYRRTTDGEWQQVTRPQTQPGGLLGGDFQSRTRLLNQETMARELGQARERSFQFSRPVFQGGGGRLRGGGFRR